MLLLCNKNEKDPTDKTNPHTHSRLSFYTTALSTVLMTGQQTANPLIWQIIPKSFDFAHTGCKRERRSCSSPPVDSCYTLGLQT